LIQKAKADKRYEFDAIFMGRINETKGIYDMLKALNLVRKNYPDFQLAIMGDGDLKTKREFQGKIKELDLEKNIKFLGFRSGLEKFNILKSAKCFWFLSVSESESFGVALLEAVCCGLPAFTYDLPPFLQIYTKGEIDISPKGNYRLIAEKVIQLFESRNFTNKKGRELLGKYSWKKIAEIEYDAMGNL
jgi:glycosyltransferase involved in cell wall biosynthesis